MDRRKGSAAALIAPVAESPPDHEPGSLRTEGIGAVDLDVTACVRESTIMTSRLAARMSRVTPSAIRELLRPGADPSVLTFPEGFDTAFFAIDQRPNHARISDPMQTDERPVAGVTALGQVLKAIWDRGCAAEATFDRSLQAAVPRQMRTAPCP